MAETENIAPETTPEAPVAAPEVSAPVPGGDTSALAPTTTPSPTGTSDYQNAIQGENTALRSVQELSKPTPPPPPVPHARLLAMVHGLAIGLGAAATSMGTGGREGGAAEVTRIRGEEQQQKIQAKQAVEAQKNTQIQQQLMIADTNHKLSQNILLLATLPDEIAKSHMSTEAAATGLAEQKFNLFAGTGMNPAQIDKLTSGGAVDAKTSDMLKTNAQQQYRIASQLLPEDNPSIAGLKTVLDNPNSTPAQLVIANKRLQAEVAGQKDITADKIKQAEAAATAPFGPRSDALNSAMLQRYQIMNPKAKALPDGLSLSAASTPKDFDRIDKVMQQTETAQATKVQRDTTNQMRKEMLDLAKGVEVPGDTSKTGAEYMASLPAGMQGTVKAIGEGREPPPPTGSRSPAAQSLNAAVNRAYPNYDATRFPAYQKMRTAFTSGKEAQGINSFNTVANHLARMYDHTKATATLPGVSGVARAFGDETAAALNSDRQAVATELSKAYAGGQISEGEVNEWNKKLKVWSPAELRNNIKEISSLLQGKLDAYQNQWETGMPVGVVSPIHIVSPAAQSAFDHIHGKAGGESQTTGHKVGDTITQNGHTYTVNAVDSTGKVTGATPSGGQ